MDNKIPFVQFMPPKGAHRIIYITVEPATAIKAKTIIDCGLEFHVEILRNGMVSLTICDPNPDGRDVAIKVVPNDPSMKESVERLVKEFDLDAYVEEANGLH